MACEVESAPFLLSFNHDAGNLYPKNIWNRSRVHGAKLIGAKISPCEHEFSLNGTMPFWAENENLKKRLSKPLNSSNG